MLISTALLLDSNIPNSVCTPAKVISILKPGKPANEASSYRPISLLSVCHKFLEKLIYNRISPIIEENLPIEQAGFRPNRNCCDQVLALTSYIESGFQKRLKTGVVFVDLTAAYDTVWKDGLIHKLYNIIPCGKMVSFLEDMLSNRQFRVFVEDKSSKFRFLNNGLSQGSVMTQITSEKVFQFTFFCYNFQIVVQV
jgi:hypothetical protein